ncbi:unnamed protein product [marine sediment metagenome]|uniref:Uncharacterized protein n=1 Tax=marine sediment metagenome TaxID=412755 RepID=X1AVE7_9ZZZZ
MGKNTNKWYNLSLDAYLVIKDSEIIEVGTGIIQGYDQVRTPPVTWTDDRASWDGMSGRKVRDYSKIYNFTTGKRRY